MEKHRNVAVIERFFAAYNKGDVAQSPEILAPNVTWSIPGRLPRAGTKIGVDEVLAFFDRPAIAKFKAEPRAIGGDVDYVIDYHGVERRRSRPRQHVVFGLSF